MEPNTFITFRLSLRHTTRSAKLSECSGVTWQYEYRHRCPHYSFNYQNTATLHVGNQQMGLYLVNLSHDP